MIALNSCIAKVYHQLLAYRFCDYLTSNNLIDVTLQKAFIQGINGCIEHTQVMQELIRHAKANNKTLHVTWFDLADAFGSVQNNLIFHELERNMFPDLIQQYVRELYSNLNGYVKGPSWNSNIFTFKRGVFQGDPLSRSPIIFLLAFNPILQYLKTEEK